MDTVCRGLDFVFVYLDNILIASFNHSQDAKHLNLLFQRLRDHGLVVNPAKCIFGVKEIDFLGHHVTEQGATPLPNKVDAIRNFIKPLSRKGLQEFVGMVYFYHRFMPHTAKIMQPLYQALSGKAQNPIIWTDIMSEAFNSTKSALAQATLLAHPHSDAPTALTVDASDKAIGGVLEQEINGK